MVNACQWCGMVYRIRAMLHECISWPLLRDCCSGGLRLLLQQATVIAAHTMASCDLRGRSGKSGRRLSCE